MPNSYKFASLCSQSLVGAVNCFSFFFSFGEEMSVVGEAANKTVDNVATDCESKCSLGEKEITRFSSIHDLFGQC